MTYRVPDSWTSPNKITWFTCDNCNMIYGDGKFSQTDLNIYYRERYGYGVNFPANIQRLKSDAAMIAEIITDKNSCIVDFGGAGDDGEIVLVKELLWHGFGGAVYIGAGDGLPDRCDLIYASHVLEHIYDLPETMARLKGALVENGLLIVDVPDATGLLLKWRLPMLDFNAKHLNHFTLRHLLELGTQYGFEAVKVKPYELEGAPAYQVHFRQLDVAHQSMLHVNAHMGRKIRKLQEIKEPVNIWGLSDTTWHLLSMVNLDVLDYIDNDPAYLGQTYNGKRVMDRPTNSAPIVVLAQGQRGRLIENINKICSNEIIEI